MSYLERAARNIVEGRQNNKPFLINGFPPDELQTLAAELRKLGCTATVTTFGLEVKFDAA